jgi:orotidine-5'-phosphate decarboxylase
MLITDLLIRAIEEKSCPIVVGLDPVLERIPDSIKQTAENKYGNTLQAAAESLYQFNFNLLNTLHSVIPAVKLQIACYEMYGQWGMNAFQQTLELAKSLNLIVINDSKRSDIGSTAIFYANGHLGKVPLIKGEDTRLKADFLTINPLLGSDSLNPFIQECQRSNKGLFILARTSNASAAEYQEAIIDGQPLYKKIAADIQKLACDQMGERGYSSIGAVVGATWPREIEQLREIMPDVFFLMPGYGAQGASADQLTTGFDQKGLGALVNSSRGVIFAYQSPEFQEKFPNPMEYAGAALEAVLMMRDDLLRSLRQAGKLPDNW